MYAYKSNNIRDITLTLKSISYCRVRGTLITSVKTPCRILERVAKTNNSERQAGKLKPKGAIIKDTGEVDAHTATLSAAEPSLGSGFSQAADDAKQGRAVGLWQGVWEGGKGKTCWQLRAGTVSTLLPVSPPPTASSGCSHLCDDGQQRLDEAGEPGALGTGVLLSVHPCCCLHHPLPAVKE